MLASLLAKRHFRVSVLGLICSYIPVFCVAKRSDLQENELKRIDSLDGLRGVACLSVLLFHAGIMAHPFGPDVFYSLVPGASAVMVFYVLSGVVLSIVPFRCLAEQRTYDWFGYFPRRMVRLCIPLFSAIAIGVVAGFVSHSMGMQSRSALAVDYGSGVAGIMHDIFMQFDMLFNVSDDGTTLGGEPLRRVDSPVWSMSWELWFSILLPLVLFVVWRIRRDWLAVACIAVLLLASHFSGYFPLRLCLMFVLGTLLAKHLGKLSAVRMPAAVEILATVASLALIELPVFFEGALTHAACSTLMNMSCMGLVAIAMTDGVLCKALSCRVCRWLGKISYSMYLTHAIVIGGLAAFLPKLGLSGLSVSVVALAASFAFAWVFWRLVERPSIGWSRRLQSRAGE